MRVVKEPSDVLQDVYGFTDFRPMQKEVIDSVLAGKDTFVIFKTSGGKSLCFQIPALCCEGTAIVISPLVALMKDQVDNARSAGISAAYINSTQSSDERNVVIKNFVSGTYKLIYISPERLTENFIQKILSSNISFLAIDEAHCVSKYGHNFRPDYLNIGKIFDKIEEHKGVKIPRIALTATAPVSIRQDIIEQLKLKHPNEFIGDFDRDNIELRVEKTDDKRLALGELLNQFAHEPVIIYCSTVKSVNALYEDLGRDRYSVTRYHGKLTSEQKNQQQEEFISGKCNIMIATCAFGMGVDKSDIRTVIHYQLPGDLESYYQEAGRVGRDGEPGQAVVLYHKNDKDIQKFFIDTTFPPYDEIRETFNFLSSIGSQFLPWESSSQVLADYVPGSISVPVMESIIRELQSTGLISCQLIPNRDMENPEAPDEYLIDPESVDFYSVDFSYIDESRRRALNDLDKMVKYCITPNCRTQNVMDHFGQNVPYGCDHCDNCLDSYTYVDKHRDIPLEHLVSTLEIGNYLFNAEKQPIMINVLMGVMDRYTNTRGYNTLDKFGALVSWNEQSVSELIEALQEGGLLGTDKSPLEPTEEGHKVLNGKLRPSIKINSKQRYIVHKKYAEKALIQQLNDKKAVVVRKDDHDVEFLSHIRKAREFMSRNFSKPVNVVLTENEMKEIMFNRPNTLKDLAEIGFSSNKVSTYGKMLIQILNKYYKKEAIKKESVPDLSM